MIIESTYSFGDTLYLKTDKEQLPRIVTGFSVRPNGTSLYLTSGTIETPHYEFEVTKERDILIATTD